MLRDAVTAPGSKKVFLRFFQLRAAAGSLVGVPEDLKEEVGKMRKRAGSERNMKQTSQRNARPNVRPRGRLVRVLLGGVLCMGLIAPISTTAPVAATAWDPHVHMSGHIDCGGIDSAEWMWWEASNGERGWADLSQWTSVTRWFAPLRLTKLVKVQTYNLDLWKVPTSGTTLKYTVGCVARGVTGGVIFSSQFSGSYGVNRPKFGTSHTRHICRPGGAFVCFV